MASPSITRVQTGIRGAQVSLGSRTRIESKDSNLHSVEGAQKLISVIEGRRIVYSLQVSHNELGDDGGVALFNFLSSTKGRQNPISGIHIGSNKLKNASLLATAAYLKGNRHLQILDLSNNDYTGDLNIGSTFAHAVNASCLETLNLASNNGLSDTFISSFLSLLDCRSLRSLSLTTTGITPASVPHIADYLSSRRCHLDTFSVNSNRLENAGIQAIYDALNSCDNYRLTRLSVFANQGDVDQATLDENKRIQSVLRILVARNMHLNQETQADALRLLRYSRPLLLHSEDTQNKPTSGHVPCNESCSCFPTVQLPNQSQSPSPEPPFNKLPTEMKHYILSFLAPKLSPAQRIRIFRFASSASTLPQLLPCLPSRGAGHSICVPDPSSIDFGDTNKIWKIGGGGIGSGGGCAAGKCLGSSNSVVCHREQDSKAWLASIRCDVYEREGSSSTGT
ncbi:hypothetical protein H0H87_008772 [Tephrocybe sp. NHM501043]|nr:hypothetical protein H0H87_008772 [Tephrocybe sp. NHM501043]